MSARNSSANKAAARERLRAEREKQAKRDKIRKQSLVAGSGVVVLAIAAGVVLLVHNNNKPSAWEAAGKVTNVVAPKNTSGTDGTTVVIGKSTAKKTLVEAEDPRCPICMQAENGFGATIHKDVDAGKYKLQYIGADFIDDHDNGQGSKNGLSALGAALNVSPDAFLQYKSAMYSAKFHPDENSDKFKSDAYLLKIADTVPALKGNATFQKDVKDGTFDAWALKMAAKFNKDGYTATPTFKVDGKTLSVPGGQDQPPLTQDQFNSVIAPALK
ncbi:thioredoxin domain-containing protein [Streptomyces sp. 8L]|uniref:thioredoxin domain-containing protein n=1 Tax=unclassified Streptomyces TaxID=2593676 RepID=UPI001CD5076A|nr:thioredoxin domain-containing protein [Streptomyces sp. 8L]MCA1220515.1 DsbA family protein [Streptomyces sp. 8L]